MSKGPLETIAELWDEVLDPPRQGTVGGTRSKQSSKPPANLDGLELRAEAHKLANEAGISTFPRALRIKSWGGAWLSKWQALADKFVALARPEQVQGIYIGKCPQCAEDKRWHEGQTIMVCDCGLYGSKKAWIGYMQTEEVPESMNTLELAAFLSAKLDKEVRATAIRNWKSRGHIEAVGKDAQGRPLYKPLDVLTWARAKGEGLRLPID